MTKFLEDSIGPTPLINDRQLESWRLLKTRFDLTDAYFLPQTFTRTCFTRRSVHGPRLDQSRLVVVDFGFMHFSVWNMFKHRHYLTMTLYYLPSDYPLPLLIHSQRRKQHTSRPILVPSGKWDLYKHFKLHGKTT